MAFNININKMFKDSSTTTFIKYGAIGVSCELMSHNFPVDPLYQLLIGIGLCIGFGLIAISFDIEQ